MPLKLNSTGGGSVTLDTPSTAGTYTVTVPATNQTLGITSGTAATASGTAVNFTGIPSWVKRITVMFNGVSTNGTSDFLIQLGASGGVETTGYLGACSTCSGSAVGTSAFTAGFEITSSSAANVIHGALVISILSSNTWVCQGNNARSNSATTLITAGSKSLSGILTQVRITTSNGTDTFDAGTINILYEG